MKRVLALILTGLMIFSLVACSSPAPAEQPQEQPASSEQATETKEKFKIAIYTNTVSQNEEEFRSGEAALKKYGPEMIVTQTMPDNFMKEQETLIANALALVSDPEVKALIMNQAVPGAAAAFEKVRETRPDVYLVAITPGETDVIADKADLVLQPDELAMGYAIPAQAAKMGAKTFVHYSFPRHMSYPLLAQRRDIFREECQKLGMTFVDATAPDPTGDAGIPGAQQFILEDVPRKVKEYGKDTNFFSTNCSMQEPLIKACLETGAINAQQCCPSPYHGYPGALGIDVQGHEGDIDYLVGQIKAKIAEKGGTGRFSTWPVPFSMMSTAAAVEYVKGYLEGTITNKVDLEALKKCYQEASGGYDLEFSTYDNKDNFVLVLSGYITF